MNKLKNELIYQWRLLRSNIIGGYQEVKKVFNLQNLKEKFELAIKNMEEKDAYEAEQKKFRKHEILQNGDIVEFRDLVCPGNIIRALVIDVNYKHYLGAVEIYIEIIDDGLRNKGKRKFVYQHDILNNLIKIEQPYLD